MLTSSNGSAASSRRTIPPRPTCLPAGERVYRSCFLDIVKHAEVGARRAPALKLLI